MTAAFFCNLIVNFLEVFDSEKEDERRMQKNALYR